MSDTPRTDNMERYRDAFAPEDRLVTSIFSRQLERELSKALIQIEQFQNHTGCEATDGSDY